tara:strand:- start:7551 stop:8909 length:1359 start_codon:yes stop_codon:yes gene_type:complete
MEHIPIDNRTENSVLGGLITYPKYYDKVVPYIATDEVFVQTRARRLWKKISKMIRDNKQIDMVTMCQSIADGDRGQGLTQSYIVDCTSDIPLQDMIEVYARTLYEKYLIRIVVSTTDKIKEEALKNGDDVYGLLTETHTTIGELISINPSEEYDIDNLLGDTIDSLKNKETKLVKTGLKKIDSFAGGLTRGEITIVGGRPGHGKTTFLINLVSKMRGEGHRCMLFNRELPNSEVIKKLICRESRHLSYTMVRKGIFSDFELNELEKTKKVICEKYNANDFKMYDNIKNFAKTAAEVKKFKPDVVFDDYIQLIDGAAISKDDNRRLQLERLVNDYKWLAKENGCAVILASQLNRYLEARGKGARPQLSDLAESGAIEQVAENVFFVYYGYKAYPDKFDATELTMVASKVRYGETGDSVLYFDGDKCLIDDDRITTEVTNESKQEKKSPEELPF